MGGLPPTGAGARDFWARKVAGWDDRCAILVSHSPVSDAAQSSRMGPQRQFVVL